MLRVDIYFEHPADSGDRQERNAQCESGQRLSDLALRGRELRA